MRSFALLLLTAGAAAAQTYSVTTLAPPPGFVVFNLDGSMNNKGQVLGDAGMPGPTNRGPVVLTGGVPQILPMPPGHVYLAVLSTYKINDAGTVIGTVQESGSTRTHIAVWNAGVPSVLPDAPMPGACVGPGCTCSTVGSSTSYWINTAGHILGGTTYPSLQGGGPPCSGFWVYTGASYRILPVAKPSQCPVNTTNSSPDAMNDADQVLEDVTNFFCTGFPAVDPAVLQPSGSYSLVPLGPLAALRGSSINNLGNVLGYYTAPTHEVVWDAQGIHDLGNGGWGFMNNLGQVAYISNPQEFAYQIQIWKNGVSTPIQVPAGLPLDPHNVPGLGGFNDAGQIAVQIPGGSAYLLSPAGPCAQNVNAQVQITRSGFRFNRGTGHFTQTVTVTNTGGSSIAGPISLALDNVPVNATLFGISGVTLCAPPQGSLYLNLAAASLDPGAPVTGTVEFIDTANTGINYDVRVLAGPGGR